MGLEALFGGDPRQQGILAAAAQILQASGPSRMPTSLGQILGSGMMAGQQATYEAQQRAALDQARRLQMEEAQLDLQTRKETRALKQQIDGFARDSYQTAGQQAAALPGGPTVVNAARIGEFQDGFDVETFLNKVSSVAPMQAMEYRKLFSKAGPEFDTKPQTGVDENGRPFQYIVAKDGSMKRLDGVLPREKLENVNGKWVNPFAQQDGALAPQDPNQPFSIGANGGPVANRAYQQYQISKARAGASNVSVNTATKPFLSEIGKGAGEAVNSAYQGALAASKTLQNVDQIRQGLGNAIIGPGAGVRVTLAQIGQTLGVTGKDTSEQLANTRMVVQGLARQEMSAAEAMKGQGQITESERGILRRAESGMVGDFTAPELNTLLGALEKTARYRIGAHQSNMQRLQADPNARAITDYMRVEMPSAATPAGAAPGDIDELLKKYGGK